MAKNKALEATERRGHWQEELSKAKKRWEAFQRAGDTVVDKYRLERNGQSNEGAWKDSYNILYSTTETIRPNLYMQTPKVEAVKRHKDRSNPTVTLATTLIESVVQYALEEVDIDTVMDSVVEDYTLPGLGAVWVRYTPSFKDEPPGADGKPAVDDKGDPRQLKDYDALALDYVYWKDVLVGPARTWAEVPWIARRVYMDKETAKKRFKDKAEKIGYSTQQTRGDSDVTGVDMRNKQAEIWEIWDKRNRKAYWYCETYPDDMLDTRDDPLRLKGFFPTPRPLRAITNTKTMVPRCFYSQYQAQAIELDKITARIRVLTEALQVRGVYDGSMESLANLLQNKAANTMIPVANWQQFVSNGGMVGSVQWVPIQEIASVLMNLIQAREAVKGEIYEISGFSDIVRGVSKASETLGAQEIKTNWSSARLKRMQKEVQRYVRDIIRIMTEVILDQFSIESLAIYSGFDTDGMQPPQAAVAMQAFSQVVELLKTERERCANIGIETDSTIAADEAEERKDRMEFLASAGAFLQQAMPAAQQFPDMRGLIGAIMMFTIRTFRASRPIEQAFEEFQKKLEAMPPTDPNAKPGEGGDNGAAAAQATVAGKQMDNQTKQAIAQSDAAMDRYKVDTDAAVEREAESNRHAEKMKELELREREVAVRERELDIKKAEAAAEIQLGAADQEHRQDMDSHHAAMEARGAEHKEAVDGHNAGLAERAQKVAERPQPPKGS